jgi:hypothetical protein
MADMVDPAQSLLYDPGAETDVSGPATERWAIHVI